MHHFYHSGANLLLSRAVDLVEFDLSCHIAVSTQTHGEFGLHLESIDRGERKWIEDDTRAIFEISRREGQIITSNPQTR